MSKKTFNVGVIGYGTIGTGVVRILLKDQKMLAQKAGFDIKLKTVADLKIEEKEGIDQSKFQTTGDAGELLNDPEIDIVVEVIGGVKPAKSFIETALKNKKHVVTANKELIAKHGKDLIALAKANNVNLYFEASAGGGIPIINAISKSLAANKFEKIYGILNGTTNYILSKMYNEGADYADVLKEAQDLGYAEANPAADVEGDDVAYKLSILGSIAFDSYFDYKDVYKEGITNVSVRDIEIAKEFDCVIKLLAIGIAHDDENVEMRVHPVMIHKNHPLAAVNESFNAVYAVGENVGETMFYGRGAGELPTASAIMGDVVDIVRHSQIEKTNTSLDFGNFEKNIVPMGDIYSRYFLRLLVKDEAGVLAAISNIFGDNNVSIRAVQQKDSFGVDAELVIITHSVKEAEMQNAVSEIKKIKQIKEVCSLIRADL